MFSELPASITWMALGFRWMALGFRLTRRVLVRKLKVVKVCAVILFKLLDEIEIYRLSGSGIKVLGLLPAHSTCWNAV